MKIYMNGKLVPESARVSVFDHGLLYGDGVFEGIRAYNKRVFMLDEHGSALPFRTCYRAENPYDAHGYGTRRGGSYVRPTA